MLNLLLLFYKLKIVSANFTKIKAELYYYKNIELKKISQLQTTFANTKKTFSLLLICL